ncbi:MAG: hypothetical protein RIT45_792 [Pseudomonadota bacterium]
MTETPPPPAPEHSIAALVQRDPRTGRQVARAEVEAMRAIGDQRRMAIALTELGHACWLTGDDGGALRALLEALAIFESAEDSLGVANCERQIGIVHVRAEDTDRALASFHRALARYEALGHDEGLAATHNNLAGALHSAGRLDEAVAALEASLRHCLKLEQPGRVALTQVALATVQLGRGELDDAERLLDAAAAVQRHLGERHGLAHALEQRGRLLRWRGDASGAIRSAQEAVVLATETGNRPLQRDALEVIAEAAATSNDFELAYRSKRRASQLTSELERERRARELDQIRVQFASDRAEQDAELARMRLALAEQERDRAHQASAARDTFVAHVSHEIRTPLNGILGMTDVLLGDACDDEHRRRLRVIQSCGRTLLHLINDLLDLSRLEAGGMRVERRPMRLGDVLGGVVELLEPLADEAGLRLTLTVDPALPEMLWGDPHRLTQVLNNLVGNAIKFTEHGGVDIVARTKGRDRYRIEVRDSGVGIDAAELDVIFEPFTQAQGGRTRPTEGTGLGLAIVRRLCEALGGHCGAESEVGVGSLFWLELPLEAAQAILPPRAPPRRHTSGVAARRRVRATWSTTLVGRKVRVLVAEDDPVNQELIRLQLRQHGTEPLLVDRGTMAVAACRSQAFDLVLMDVRMPELDGIAATAEIRASDGIAQPLIVAVTANATVEEERACIEAGMDGFISKPIDAAALAGWLARASADAAIDLVANPG